MIVGASGNVGPFCVQLAKSRGAEVTAVASGQKLDFVRALGADHVIDYKTTDSTATGRAFRPDHRRRRTQRCAELAQLA